MLLLTAHPYERQRSSVRNYQINLRCIMCRDPEIPFANVPFAVRLLWLSSLSTARLCVCVQVKPPHSRHTHTRIHTHKPTPAHSCADIIENFRIVRAALAHIACACETVSCKCNLRAHVCVCACTRKYSSRSSCERRDAELLCELRQLRGFVSFLYFSIRVSCRARFFFFS